MSQAKEYPSSRILLLLETAALKINRRTSYTHLRDLTDEVNQQQKRVQKIEIADNYFRKLYNEITKPGRHVSVTRSSDKIDALAQFIGYRNFQHFHDSCKVLESKIFGRSQRYSPSEIQIVYPRNLERDVSSRLLTYFQTIAEKPELVSYSDIHNNELQISSDHSAKLRIVITNEDLLTYIKQQGKTAITRFENSNLVLFHDLQVAEIEQNFPALNRSEIFFTDSAFCLSLTLVCPPEQPNSRGNNHGNVSNTSVRIEANYGTVINHIRKMDIRTSISGNLNTIHIRHSDIG